MFNSRIILYEILLQKFNIVCLHNSSHNSLHVDPIDECDQQIKEFVDVVTSINESGKFIMLIV